LFGRMAEAASPTALLKVQQTALALIYWEDQKKSAAVMGVGLLWFALIGWIGFSSVTVLCYAALFHLVARFLYRLGCRVLADLGMIQKQPVPEAPTTFVTEEEVQLHLKTATALVNSTLHAAYTLAVCDCTPLVIKWIFGLYAAALAGKLFGTTGLCFMAFVAAFSLPKIYMHKQAQIDKALLQASEKAVELSVKVGSHANKYFRELLSKLPSIPKASDYAAKSATNVKAKAL